MSNFGYSTAPVGYTTVSGPQVTQVPVVHTQTFAGVPVATTTHAYGLMGDPERRLNESSARQLARLVFMKYDDNDSGFINSHEAARLITDLYASCNMNYNATPEEGKEFMRANDSDKNWEFNRQDFEDFFVKHLSTQSNQVGFNLFTETSGVLTKLEFSHYVRGAIHKLSVSHESIVYRSPAIKLQSSSARRPQHQHSANRSRHSASDLQHCASRRETSQPSRGPSINN